MKTFDLAIVCRDEALAEAAAEAVSLKRRGWNVSVCDYPGEGCGFVLTDIEDLARVFRGRSLLLDGSVSCGEAVAFIEETLYEAGEIQRPMAVSGRRGLRSILFTSCRGGQGVSTCARLLAGRLSRLKERSVLYLSFDPFIPRRPGDAGADVSSDASDMNGVKDSSQSLERLFCRLLSPSGINTHVPEDLLSAALVRDRYGVYMPSPCAGFSPLYRADRDLCERFLNLAAESVMFDDLILDVPCGHPSLKELASVCEFRFFVRRKDTDLSPNSYFERFLKDSADEDGAVFGIFEPEYDEWAGRLDIHGQLGSEVKRFAESCGIE